ncbi:MAG: hypothetical protein AW12_00834 [Candidatus Accumulibacter sp. BA-94]|uniref:hypothetical protein n=1 Tax=Accumulibacter sp. TaxID=2053492 RepID=UPI000452A4E2|nr:hypothetical protein [Accumulibacter sp.]EXI92091.1 MAG: hypothetical protein AW12_00834 [Candidatus Accumulibacter sp. BA-94]HRD86780.1 hypothetical protein [Accumulibacter sp.]
MNTLIFLLVATLVLYVMSLHIHAYNELRFTAYRFRYFELRDKLAMLVVQGKLREDSWEYQHIVSTINFHISAVKTVSIIRLVTMLIRYHTSSIEQQQVRALRRNIGDPAVARIMVEYMETTMDLIRRNSRAQIALIGLATRVMDRFGSKARPEHELVVNPNEALTAIETRKSEFQAAAAA